MARRESDPLQPLSEEEKRERIKLLKVRMRTLTTVSRSYKPLLGKQKSSMRVKDWVDVLDQQIRNAQKKLEPEIEIGVQNIRIVGGLGDLMDLREILYAILPSDALTSEALQNIREELTKSEPKENQ